MPIFCFYQERGFHLVAIYPNALERSRQPKPEIPEIGLEGIPLRDEIELEINLKETIAKGETICHHTISYR